MSALKQNRTRIPQEWFEKQYAGFAAQDKITRAKTEALLEARRQKSRDFAVANRRVRDRLQAEIRPRQQAKRDEVRASLEHKMTVADARVAAKMAKMEASIVEGKEQRAQGVVERREYFADADQRLDKRAASLARLAPERTEAAQRARDRRLSEISEKAQRQQSRRASYQTVRDRFQQERVEESQFIKEKHQGLSAWLQDLDQQKRTMVRQRKVDGAASTLQRQAIIQTSYDQWHQTLRATHLPDDPKLHIRRMPTV